MDGNDIISKFLSILGLYFTDINECNTDNGGCDHNCTNKVGTFSCNCSVGYMLDTNGLSCFSKIIDRKDEYIINGLYMSAIVLIQYDIQSRVFKFRSQLHL